MMRKKLISFLLALSLLTGLAAPALAAETAAVIRLAKTTGTVEIKKSSGKEVSLISNMRLYGGYHIVTDRESYAWVSLDDSKLLKEDANSEIEIRKDGKKLEVLVSSGNVFFDVAEPLEDDESLNIRTSTMVVGIRGTSGWVQISGSQVTRISILEGETECSVSDPVTGQLKTETIQGGETARGVVYGQDRQGDKCDIIKETIDVGEIPGYVLTDVVRDMGLCDKIKENTGLDILEELAKEAGGDPSGRAPDGKSASPEVLGIADRREDQNEEDLSGKLEDLGKKREELDEKKPVISPDKALEKKPAPPPPPDDDDDDDPTPAPAPTPTPDPEPTPPEPPPPTQVVFDANGGTIGDDPSTTVTIGENGLAPWPSDPRYGETPTPENPNIGLTFLGWYTAKAGGTEVDSSKVFEENTTLYAQWDGWFIDNAGTLTIAGQGSMGKYFEFSFSHGEQYSVAQWQKDYFPTIDSTDNRGNPNIKNVLILEGMTDIVSYPSGPGAFMCCDNLTGVTIPSTVTIIESGALFECGKLTSVVFQPGSELQTVRASAFNRCTSLKNITLPASVTMIDGYSFSGCTALETVIIQEGAADLQIISNAFIGCTGLKSVTIPKNVTYIGEGAFTDCASNLAVTYGGTISQWRSLFSRVSADQIFPADATVTCSDGTYTIDGESGLAPPPVDPGTP